MKCAVSTGNDYVMPANAGLLFFGHDPQVQLIQGEVVCVLFRETIGASRYADRKIITGPLQELIDGAEAFLNSGPCIGDAPPLMKKDLTFSFFRGRFLTFTNLRRKIEVRHVR